MYHIDKPFIKKMFEEIPSPWYKKIFNIFKFKSKFGNISAELRNNELPLPQKALKVIKYLKKDERISPFEEVQGVKPFTYVTFEATPVHFDHPAIDIKVWVGTKIIKEKDFPERKYFLFLFENSSDDKEYSSFRALTTDSDFFLNRLNLPWLDSLVKKHYESYDYNEQADIFFQDPLGTLEVVGAKIGRKRSVTAFIRVTRPDNHFRSNQAIYIGYALHVEEYLSEN